MSQHKSSQHTILAQERGQQALGLRKQGYTLEEIAHISGYADRSGAYRAVMRALKRLPPEPLEGSRTLELMRLDALWRAVWPQAEQGDLKAIQTALKIIERRSKLQGLDIAPEPRKAPERDGKSLGIVEALVDATPPPADPSAP